MTGAPLPEGADAVQIQEGTDRSANGPQVTIKRPVKPGDNIRPRGSEARRGDIILEADRLVGAAEIAVMATFGLSQVSIWRKPRVAIVSTGDELVDVESSPGPDQIRNTNSHSLAAQLENMQMASDYLGIARDDKEELRRFVAEGLKRDVLLLTGGVSVGRYDYAKEVFRDLGIDIIFTRVAVKPGKPTVFARHGDSLVFGLPGNPVSTFVTFELFVRPALGRLLGYGHPELPRVKGELLDDMRQSPGRTAFLPARVFCEGESWKIQPLSWQGSGDIIGFSRGNGTVIFPGDRDYMAAGERVEAMLLPDFRGRRP
jgi:molybdopterin molybdotransferase